MDRDRLLILGGVSAAPAAGLLKTGGPATRVGLVGRGHHAYQPAPRAGAGTRPSRFLPLSCRRSAGTCGAEAAT